MGIKSPYGLLGLFHGVGLPFRSESAPLQMPNMIWLYRRPILDYWADHDETLGAIIKHVLVHEIGHHFGLSDDDMHAIERAAAGRRGGRTTRCFTGAHEGRLYESRWRIRGEPKGATQCESTAAVIAASSPSRAKPIRRRRRSVTAPIARPAPARRSAFQFPVPGASFKMTGQPTTYLKTTCRQRPAARAGVLPANAARRSIRRRQGDGVQPSYTVRVGILRQRDQLAPRRQQWFRSARPWVTELASVPKSEKQS